MSSKFRYIIIIVLLYGCAPGKNLTSTVGEIPEMRTKQILKKHIKQHAKFNTLQCKLKVELFQNSKAQSNTVTLRMDRGKTIWINAFLNLIRIKITPDRVQMYNKIDKTYFDGDFSLIKQLLGIDLDFSNLENLLLGDTFFKHNSSSLNQVKDNTGYTLKPYKLDPTLNVLYRINPFYFKMKTQEISHLKEEIHLKVNYDDFQEINQQLIPSKMAITINEKQNNTFIKLNLKSVSLNQSIRFPFKLPKGYKLLNF
tara:strand:+ start:4426 stop:5190 length:765 start_codon:yes stop_codon:yes gene_type:complete